MTMEWEEINWHIKALAHQLQLEPNSIDFVSEACKRAINNNDWPFSMFKFRDEILPKLLPYEFYEEENGAWGAAHLAFYRVILDDPEFEMAIRDEIDESLFNKIISIKAIYGEEFAKFEYFSHEPLAPYALKKHPYSSNDKELLRISRVDGEHLDLIVQVQDYFNLINGLLENLPTNSLKRSYDDNRPEEIIEKLKQELELLRRNNWEGEN